MAKLDPRGAPDYSHYDYAAEGIRMYEQGKREGAADKANGKEPNAYLYRVASPDYSYAKGYREGYGEPVDVDGRMNVATYDDWFPDLTRPIATVRQGGASSL